MNLKKPWEAIVASLERENKELRAELKDATDFGDRKDHELKLMTKQCKEFYEKCNLYFERLQKLERKNCLCEDKDKQCCYNRHIK